MSTSRPRVLIESYEFSPVRGHAPGSAWEIVSRLVGDYEVWVIAEKTQYESETRTFLAGRPELSGNVHPVFIPGAPCRDCGTGRSILPVGDVLLQKVWLRKSFETARELHRTIGFDVVHHLRRHSFREPGYLWKLSLPFVWGPTGGELLPWRAMNLMNPRARVLYSVKNIVSKLQFRHSVLIRRAANAASTIIAQSRSSLQRFRMLGARRCVLGSEIAADQPKRGPRMYPGGRPLKVAWAGRFIALKALPVLLMAAALPSLKGKLVVHIAGDGPCRKQWQSMASRLGIAQYCIWHGWLSEEATLSMLDDSDVLAFTSLAEGTPATVMRALSLGLPTICLGHCGYGEVVDHTCGILIYPGSSRCIVDGFANALAALVAHPEEIGKLSRGAIEKACHCGWESVACTIREAYKLALTPPC